MILNLYFSFLTVVVGILVSHADERARRWGYALFLALFMGLMLTLHDDLRDIVALLESLP